jgi:hypothetical protein
MAALRAVLKNWPKIISARSTMMRPAMLRYSVSANQDDPEPPNGFLFNEKPLLPGEKRQKEDWENIWVYGMGSCMLLLILVGAFKPGASLSLWARKKAEERLKEKEAIITDE